MSTQNVSLKYSLKNYRTNQRSKGFTLLEIMVAMTVLSLIVTAAFGALRLGQRSWETGLNQTAKTENLRTVTGALQRIFSQALPLSWKEKTETTIAFEGDDQYLRFIAPAPQHHGATGLFEYTLTLKPLALNNQLMLYYRLHDPDRKGFAADDVDRQEVILVENLAGVSFNYYGSAEAKAPLQWHSFWNNDAETFPAMVNIQLVSNAEQDQWPELFLPLYSSPKK